MNAPAPEVVIETDTLDVPQGGFHKSIGVFKRFYVDGREITQQQAICEHPEAIEVTAIRDKAERFCCPACGLEWNGEQRA